MSEVLLQPGERYRLLFGDAIEVLRTLAPGSIDALITDMPYSSGGQFRGDRAQDPLKKYIKGDGMDQRAWMRWCREWLGLAKRAMRRGGVFALFIDWRQLPALTDAVQLANLNWRGIAGWDKTEGARGVQGRPRAQLEYIVWGSYGPLPLEGSPIPGVKTCSVKQADKHHPTGKPTEVMRWLMDFAPDGGVVLDPFMGSGTTGVAALQTGRRFIGIEHDAHWLEVSRKRLAAADPEKPLQLEIA